jgi:two-component sensor histidine kinase/HAMP domain-containing protein
VALPIGGRAGLQGLAVPADGLLFTSVDVRIGLKISWYVLGIGTLFGVVEWRSAVAHDAVRLRVERLRGDSVRELIGAVDMLSALKENQLAARELLARTGGEQPARASAEPGAAIEDGLVAFEQQLAAVRGATEAGLATLAQAGDDPVAARDRQQIATWLDRINSEVAVHRSLVGELRELARSDPEAARKYLDDAVYPHYEHVLEPLIQGYQDAAERELHQALAVVSAALAAADRDNMLLTLVALGLVVILGVFTARTIAQPITRLQDAADRLWAGDLTVRVAKSSSDALGSLAADFNGMAEQLQSTTISKSYVDDILRSIGEILVVTDLRGRVQRVNRAAVEQLGWSERELVGRDVGNVIRGEVGAGEAEAVTRSGMVLPIVCTQADLHDSSGRLHGTVLLARDVRLQRQVEEELRGSLAEKDALLREVHHRVKNNLQVISSLLRLQAADSPSAQASRLFQESESRIHSMALIHEQLCRSGDHTRIDFRDYVDGLTRNVLSSAGEAARPVKVKLDVDPVPLDLNVAIACGLILNELLSNALKYAFPDGRSGTITVTFRCADGSATLVVADDGVGLPAAPSGGDLPTSLGFRLVAALVRQLHGVSSVEADGGTRFTLTFRIDGEPPAVAAQA